MQRRTFLKPGLLTAAAPHLRSQPDLPWGGPILDTHLHLRRDPDACFTHVQGCGVTHAVLLTTISDQDRAKQEMEKRPNCCARSVTGDPAQPDTARAFQQALQNGAVSIGEVKYHLALDSPEMRRVYDIVADMQAPVMLHIRREPSSGLKQLRPSA